MVGQDQQNLFRYIGFQGRPRLCLKVAVSQPSLSEQNVVDGRKSDTSTRGQTGEPRDGKSILPSSQTSRL